MGLTQAIGHNLTPLGSLFYVASFEVLQKEDMGKKVKKYLVENGRGTSLCICICGDIHSGTSRMTALFLNSALREAGECDQFTLVICCI